jgi:fructose-1,6-bisphosphatase II / sedoheptulose-1,7-bisphosphatase
MGIVDLNKKYELNEIVRGDSIFCATGITDSKILKGIKLNDNRIISETLVAHKSSNFKRIIKKVNLINE